MTTIQRAVDSPLIDSVPEELRDEVRAAAVHVDELFDGAVAAFEGFAGSDPEKIIVVAGAAIEFIGSKLEAGAFDEASSVEIATFISDLYSADRGLRGIGRLLAKKGLEVLAAEGVVREAEEAVGAGN